MCTGDTCLPHQTHIYWCYRTCLLVLCTSSRMTHACLNHNLYQFFFVFFLRTGQIIKWSVTVLWLFCQSSTHTYSCLDSLLSCDNHIWDPAAGSRWYDAASRFGSDWRRTLRFIIEMCIAGWRWWLWTCSVTLHPAWNHIKRAGWWPAWSWHLTDRCSPDVQALLSRLMENE